MRCRLILLCLTAALALPANALASTTRYVSTTGSDKGSCSPAACKTIAYAIGQAAAGDTISIGPGTFEEGELKIEGKALDFVGAGAGTASTYEQAHDTFIDGAKDEGPTITDTAGGSFSDLRIEGGVSTEFSNYGTRPALDLLTASSGSFSFALSEIVATEPPPPTPPPEEDVYNYAAIWMRNFAKGATSTVTITGLTVVESESGVFSENTALTLSHSTIVGFGRGEGLELEGGATVSDTSVTGGAVGANLQPGATSVLRDTIAGNQDGIVLEALNGASTSTATVRDSLVEALPSAGVENPSGAEVIASNNPGAAAHLTATGSTFVGYGKGVRSGIRVVAEPNDTATAQIFNTIAYGEDPTAPAAASDIFAEGPGTATVTAATSSYSTAKAEQGATITTLGSAGSIAGDPDFTNPAKDEFTLTSTSPLLERGDPSKVLSGELDLAGNPRIDSDCRLGHAPDIGAYELPLGNLCPVSGGSSAGTGSGAPGTGSKAAMTGVTISKLSFSAPRRATGRGKHAKRAVAGKLTFTLNQAATVKLVLERESVGHLKKSACLAKTKSKSKPKSCKLVAPVSSIELSGRTGMNTVAIPSLKLLGHMKAGRYRLVVSAIGPSGVSSAPQTVAFKLS